MFRSSLFLIFSIFLFSTLISCDSDFSDSFTAVSEVIELDDSNFESRTQSATGQTAGIWFVDFYAPWCGHCKTLAPIWKEIAENLSGSIIVAQLDATAATSTARRFGIRSFPTIKLFRDSLVYSYSGPRNTRELTEFALHGYKYSKGEPVPGENSSFSILSTGLLSESLMKVQKLIADEPLACTFLIIFGLLFGFFFALLFFWAIFDRPTREQMERSKEIHRLLTETANKSRSPRSAAAVVESSSTASASVAEQQNSELNKKSQ